VVEGLSGQAASHRSVLSEHRSEADARESASLERSRLEVIYGENASDWRVLVLREDQVVHEEIPASSADLASITADIPTPVAEGAPEPGDATDADPPPTPAPIAEDADAPGAEPDPAAQEPLPEGPVPDWVLTKFEQSIARRGEREDAPEPEE
jgi:hypothetical protein